MRSIFAKYVKLDGSAREYTAHVDYTTDIHCGKFHIERVVIECSNYMSEALSPGTLKSSGIARAWFVMRYVGDERLRTTIKMVASSQDDASAQRTDEFPPKPTERTFSPGDSYKHRIWYSGPKGKCRLYNVELLTGAGECKIQFDWSLNYRWKNRVFRTTRALRVINKISIEGISDEWASNLN